MPDMTERELRLRERIDTLTDRCEKLEGQLAEARLLTAKWRWRAYDLSAGRDMWRARARRDLTYRKRAA